MEKRRNFVGFLFRKNKNRQKIASVEEHDPYKHMKRQAQAGRHREREKKKRLVEADDEEEEAHYILYQKHIFKVNSQPKKNIFECVFLLLRVAPIESLTPLLLPLFMLSHKLLISIKLMIRCVPNRRRKKEGGSSGRVTGEKNVK